MGVSRQARSTIVPLLSRLVLAAAFVPAGWDKIMGDPVVYEGQDAAILLRLGVGGPPATAEAAGQEALAFFQQKVETGSIVPHRQPRPPDAEDEPVVIPVPPQETAPPPAPKPVLDIQRKNMAPPPPAPPPPPPAVNQPTVPSAAEPANASQGERVTARRLHRVTLMLVAAHWPESLKPQWAGWAAAGTELVGGGLILLGVFSRIWGLGLAVTMGVAFYLTSFAPFIQYGFMHLPMADFNRGFTQIGLFVMAFGVLLTGAGGLSIDGLLFGGGGYDDEEEHLLHLG